MKAGGSAKNIQITYDGCQEGITSKANGDVVIKGGFYGKSQAGSANTQYFFHADANSTGSIRVKIHTDSAANYIIADISGSVDFNYSFLLNSYLPVYNNKGGFTGQWRSYHNADSGKYSLAIDAGSYTIAPIPYR